MNQIQFDCPGCGQTIETAETSQFELVKCPTCQREFFPVKTRLVRPAPAAPPTPSEVPTVDRSLSVFPPTESEKVRRQAESFSAAASLCVVIGVLALLIGIGLSVGEGTGGGLSWLVMCAAFGLALWLYLVAQIIHIRALLSKK